MAFTIISNIHIIRRTCIKPAVCVCIKVCFSKTLTKTSKTFLIVFLHFKNTIKVQTILCNCGPRKNIRNRTLYDFTDVRFSGRRRIKINKRSHYNIKTFNIILVSR